MAKAGGTRSRKARGPAADDAAPGAKKPRGGKQRGRGAEEGAEADGPASPRAEEGRRDVFTLRGVVESQEGEGGPGTRPAAADGNPSRKGAAQAEAFPHPASLQAIPQAGGAPVGDFEQLRSLLHAKVNALREEQLEKATNAAEEKLQAQMDAVAKMAQACPRHPHQLEDCAKLNASSQKIYSLIGEFQEKHREAVDSLDADAAKMREELQKADGKEVARKFVKNFTSQIENMKKDVTGTALA
eukprot:jgi/Tetstr1/440803/TSEL_029110.t1